MHSFLGTSTNVIKFDEELPLLAGYPELPHHKEWAIHNGLPLALWNSLTAKPHLANTEYTAISCITAEVHSKLPELALHQYRVGIYAAVIAIALDESPLLPFYGGIVHDVGKLRVPTEILEKTGPLTDEEYAIIKKHPEWGDELLWQMGIYNPLIRHAARYHHVSYDRQSGYPMEDMTPFSITHIISIADAFDAMTEQRSYNIPLSIPDALVELYRCSGNRYWKKAIEAFGNLDFAPLIEITKAAE